LSTRRCAGKCLDRVVRDIKERNADAGPDELMKLIDEAMEWARADPS
jgi:hypothetical protein